MKKLISKIVLWFVALSIAMCGSYAFFTATNKVDKSYTLQVETTDGLTMTETSNNGGKLASVTTSGGAIVDANGNASTKYYEVVYTVETSKAKALKLDDVVVDSTLGNAIRVQTYMNSSEREFAPSSRTAANSLGDTVGVVNKTATLTVRMYLDGNDSVCINDNLTSTLNVTLKFSI